MAGYVSLGSMPTPNREYVVNFENLKGGLNLYELDYRIDNDESPEMKNLWWRDGVLTCRDGQEFVNNLVYGSLHAVYERLWNGHMFVHTDTKIFVVDPEDGTRQVLYNGGEDMTVRGKFFPYNEKLYYKTTGYYIVISYDEADDSFSATDAEGYTPVTYINCSYVNGSGYVYQPENRLSPYKTLWYNSAYTLTNTVTGSLSVSVEESYFRMRINVPGSYTFTYNNGWTLNGASVDPLDYGIRVGGTPVNGNTIVVKLAFVNEYYLPVDASDVTKVEVDGVELATEKITASSNPASLKPVVNAEDWRAAVSSSGTYRFTYDGSSSTWRLAGTAVSLSNYGISITGTPSADNTITVVYTRGGYWYDEGSGVVGFFDPPTVYYPEINNTVRITYKQDNEVAYNNIMDCSIAEVYGGTGALCVVMAGSKTQPNAYFWNGQNSVAMDPTYFPMTQYQLAGDMVDPITGFGKQQGYLIVFKERSVGRTSLETQTVDERLTIDLAYTAINSKIGCDLPYTIQLIENNLVWCNRSQGVHFLANTSAAYENNVVCISKKINRSQADWSKGLIPDLERTDTVNIISHDDDMRYWLVVGTDVWLWDYTISTYTKPSWFYFENIMARGFVQDGNTLWHFDRVSRLTIFKRVFHDYNQAIDKVYKFAVQYFGTYDNKKNINSIIVNTISTTSTVIDVTYHTEYETRKDLTPLVVDAWKLIPRDLSFRNLRGGGFARVFRRKPHCRRVQYFTFKLENHDPKKDLTIVSAQIYYNYQGRHR